MIARRDRAQSARELFARHLKQFRLSKGLSQEKLAARAGLHPNYVGSVERAERNVSIDNIEKIAKALAVPVAVMFTPPRGTR